MGTPITALLDMDNFVHRNYHALNSGRVWPEGEGPTTDDLFPSLQASIGRAIHAITAPDSAVPWHPSDPIDWIGVWDGGAPTFRHRLYAEYKAGRKERTPQFLAMFRELRERFAEVVPQVRVIGWEADDVIATIARSFLLADAQRLLVVISNDRDLVSLVGSDRVFVYMPPSRLIQQHRPWWTKVTARERFGFLPQFLPDYKALFGDKSDNIPGIAGCGEKKARLLVDRHGTLEDIWTDGPRHTATREDRVAARLLTPENLEQALAWRELTRLRSDVPGVTVVPFATGDGGLALQEMTA